MSKVKSAWDTIEEQVVDNLNNNRCCDSEKMILLISEEEFNKLEVDLDYKISEKSLSNLIEYCKREYSFFFKKERVDVNEKEVVDVNTLTPNEFRKFLTENYL